MQAKPCTIAIYQGVWYCFRYLACWLRGLYKNFLWSCIFRLDSRKARELWFQGESLDNFEPEALFDSVWSWIKRFLEVWVFVVILHKSFSSLCCCQQALSWLRRIKKWQEMKRRNHRKSVLRVIKRRPRPEKKFRWNRSHCFHKSLASFRLILILSRVPITPRRQMIQTPRRL